ncbi:hypothetical protein SLS60_007962 [Paraconiothyrium brasiliense]|uniref:P-loop containing nucleoside triphosphate hydrolase protein n=1 Tax=Paraconiothyrium brasiliense TaxID=300254 RepID=A0ABR3R309_9PLEO
MSTTSHGAAGSQTAIAAQILLTAVVLALSSLSLLEHVKSPRSSDAINVYLFFSIIFDAVQLRTLWLRPLPTTVCVAASVCFTVKFALWLAEAQSKFAWLKEDYRSLAPETLSGVYARRGFWWLNGLMKRGYRATFQPMDLMAIKEDFGSKRLLDILQSQSDRGRLLNVCTRAFKLDVAFMVVPRTAVLILSYTQPFLFQAIIGHLNIPFDSRNPSNGYLLITATGLLYLSLAISKTYYQHKTYQLVTKIRGALVGMLYARTLGSAPCALSDREPVTLMSVDVDGITNVVPMYNEVWASAVEIGIAVYLLQRQLGVVWVVPCGIAFPNLPFYAGPVLTFAIYVLLGKGGFTIERAFTSLSLISLLEMSTLGFIASLPQIAAAAGCLKRLEEFFYEVQPVIDAPDSTETSLEEYESMGNDDIRMSPVNDDSGRLLFSLQNATLKTGKNANSFSLRNVNLHIYQCQLVGITGPTGCGKTTLIRGLLNRLPVVDGYHLKRLDESIAYCSQTPWLPGGTIRDAIVGGSQPDDKWYNRVLDACALKEDFKTLKAADQTDVGSQGTNLSGGQKQRVVSPFELTQTMFSFTLDGRIEQLQSPPEICPEAGASSPPLQLVEAVDDAANINEVDTKAVLTTKPEENEIRGTARSTGDWALYKHYIQSAGWWRFGLLAGAHLVSAVLDNFPTVWLEQWSSVAQDPDAPDRTAFYLTIYGVSALLGLMCLLFGIWFIYMVLIPDTGRNMHNTLLDTVIHAKQSFHDTTSIGTTLNRFTQDMQHIDRDVPSATLRSMHATADCLAAFVLLSISASYTAAFIPLVLVALYYLQKFYLRTSRQLRLLEIEARAPLFTVFQETVDGLDTIIPLGWSTQWEKKLLTTLDTSQKPYYLLFCIQRWLILVLGLVVAAMATILVTFALQVEGLSSAGAIGVGLVALLNFNDRLNLLIVEWTTLETSLGAIARLKTFSQDTAAEDNAPNGEWSDQWPRQGNIEFRNVSARYRDDLPLVLNNLAFSIPAGSSCAIIGRTGSGKSSTLSVLMRLLTPSSGSIIIDGTAHTSIPLQALRSRIACLPQQPYLLPGSLRRNLDPDSHRTDADLCTVLESVRLWTVFTAFAQSTSTTAILNRSLKSSTLSPGQTQLLVLARTLLMRPQPKILVLDEFTASLDDASEKLMQQLIREEFVEKGCTIIAVAHRLRGIMDFEQVVVLDGGRVVEKGMPRALMAREGSVFRAVCVEQGIMR